MKLAAERTTTALLNSTALQALVNGKHYWEMAPDNTKGIYVAFRIAENIGLSKDRRNYDVTHWCYADTLSEASDLSDLVRAACLADGQHFRGGESGYFDTDTKEGFIKLIFNFNL